jgi:hypothetical protein
LVVDRGDQVCQETSETVASTMTLFSMITCTTHGWGVLRAFLRRPR